MKTEEAIRDRNLFTTLTLAAVLSVGLTTSSPANLLVNLTMDGDGASAGDSLTSTANWGTLGGSTSQAGTALEYQTSANGTLGADSGANGDGLAYTVPANSVTADFTIMLAVRIDGVQDQFDKIIKSDLFGDLSFALAGGDQPQWWIGSKFYDFPAHTSGWHHYAMTYDHDGGVFSGTQRSLVTMYLDGAEVYQLDSHLQTSGFGSNQDVFVMSQSFGNRPIDGAMDDFQLHDTILNEGAILAAANAALIPEPGTLALLLMGASLVWVRRRAQMSRG